MSATRIDVDLDILRDELTLAIADGAALQYGLVSPAAASRIALDVLKAHTKSVDAA